MFRQDGSCPALLKDRDPGFPYGAVTRYGPPFQTLPVPKSQATGLVRFRSPLLTESRLMSFPPATEMFQFAGFASRTYGFSSGYPLGWVAPFGDPGINDRSHLPRAFRSVPRPSSPLSAKASTRCPYFALERHTQRQGSSDVATSNIDGPISQITTNRCDKHSSLEDTSSREPTRRPQNTPSQDMTMGRTRSPATVTHTRFFTIINQPHARAAIPPPRQFLTLRRVARLASRRLLRKHLSAPHSRRTSR